MSAKVQSQAGASAATGSPNPGSTEQPLSNFQGGMDAAVLGARFVQKSQRSSAAPQKQFMEDKRSVQPQTQTPSGKVEDEYEKFKGTGMNGGGAGKTGGFCECCCVCCKCRVPCNIFKDCCDDGDL
jgi:hypothetical protein